MLNGYFKEGIASEKEIQILDVKPKVFQLLVPLMYIDIIQEEDHPSATFVDTVASPREACWEDVFLAAHRYELDELCDLAQKNIPDKLTPQTAIPFLFRTGSCLIHFEHLVSNTLSRQVSAKLPARVSG